MSYNIRYSRIKGNDLISMDNEILRNLENNITLEK